MNAAEKITKARTALVLDQFFFGALALRLKTVEDTTCKTAWVDGVSFGYNPAFIDKLNMDQTKGLWCHEVLHLALAHHARRQNRSIETWNKACDYAVNPLLVGAGMVMPTKDGLISDAFKDQSAEHIYKILHSEEQQGGGKQQQQGGKDSQQGQGSSGAGQQGQGDSSQQQQQNNDPGGCGEVRDYPGDDPQHGPTPAEMEQQAQEWQVAATQAARQAKSRGKLPGNLERLIETLNEPKVNWKEALRRFVDQIARNDYTWRRANPRFTHMNVILPTLYNEELPPIDLIIDTSGSVGEEELKQFAGEVDDILTQYNTTLRVVYADTDVRHTEEFTQDNRPVKLNAKGGGGTRFDKALKHVMDQPELPVCAIYLTDMMCSSFGPEPDFPVLWCNTSGVKGMDPPFGEMIMCEFE